MKSTLWYVVLRVLIVLAPLLVMDTLGDRALAMKFEALPELGGGSSQAFDVGHSCPADCLVVVGTSVDANGIARAVFWERLGQTWRVASLPSLATSQDSRANALPPSPTIPDPVGQHMGGWSRDALGVSKPVLWRRPDGASPWTLVPLPGLNLGAGAVFALAFPPDPITPEPVVVGASAANDLGTYKATVWRFDGLRTAYVVTQLGDLGDPDPRKVSGAYALLFDVPGRAVVYGSAENDGLVEQPVVWGEGEGGVFGPPSVLSLCAGCVAGEVLGAAPLDDTYEWSLAGWGEDVQGKRQAIFWHTNNDGASYTRHDLGVPAGFLNSQGGDVVPPVPWHVVGHADNGVPGTEVATLWTVDPVTGEVTNEPLAEALFDVPGNVTLRQATAVDGFENIVGSFTTAGARGISVVHAFIARSSGFCPDACGDIDGSGGSVNLADFATFALCFGKLASFSQACTCSDLDGGGTVNLLDFATFTLTFGGVSTNLPPSCP